ncbi:MAG: M50 family metallopeptidase [Lachnospiraceae bacterium]|nr:M50 family metallopeptidase [Lachnospiraceae bacterium]
MKIIIAILIFGFIILFHEFGHFLFAKKFGVKVNEFCLGFGPRLIGFKKGDTDYCLRLLPFGGACVMEGESEDTDDERSFLKKSLWQRAIIVAGGPLFNFLLAFILSVIMIGTMGVELPMVSKVMEGYPAEEAGLQAGDRITKLGSYNVHFYNEIVAYNFFHTGETTEVTYERDGQTYKTTLVPKLDEDSGRYLIGIYGSGERTRLNPAVTLGYSFYELKYQIYIALKSVGMLITGKVGVQDMSGPVGIVKTIGDTYQQSLASGVLYVVMNLISITILLSANLGVMNLLPFPALDGGRLLIYIIEAITRKKVPEKVEAALNGVGFVLLMVLMVLVMGSDISKIVKGQ